MINSTSSITVFFALAILAGFQIYIAAKNVTTVEIHHKGILQRVKYEKKNL